MPTKGPTRALVALMGLALSGSLLVGCSSDETTPTPARVPVPIDTEATPTPEETLPVPPNLVKVFTRLLNKRATAVLQDDRAAFLSVLDRNEALQVTQNDYFDNLIQLPLAEFDYGLRRRSLVRDGNTYSVVVDLTTQLGGFDAVPVLSQFRFQFSAKGAQKRRFVLSSVIDREWEKANGIVRQPWEARPIQVRTAPGVLGIFDDVTVAKSASAVDSVSRGVNDISGSVPLEWSRSVVLYALSDTSYQAALGEVPGGDPDKLDGLAVPIAAGPSGPASEQVAAVRFVLNPRMLGATRPELDRLVRHELTHVALGERDDRLPLWLSEGLAEYISVRPMAPQNRRITPLAVTDAEAGRITDLATDEDFNDRDQALNYAVSWFACEYVAATYGENALWSLVDQLNGEDVDVAARLQIILGVNTRTLARKSAKLIIATYDPDFFAPPATEPSGEPTDGPTDEVPDPSETGPTQGNTVGE